MLKKLINFIFLGLILTNGVVLSMGDDEVRINIWRAANPGPSFRHCEHASLETRSHYMSFRPQGRKENDEVVPGILITNLKVDLKKQGNELPHVRYILNKETLGVDIHSKEIDKKFEEILKFNGLKLSSLQQEEHTQNTNWAHKGLVSINSEELFYTEAQSSITFVVNLLRSGINETPPLLLCERRVLEITVSDLEDYLEQAVREKGQHHDDYQDIHRIIYVDQANRLKQLENENCSLKQQIADLTSKIESRSFSSNYP